MLTDDIQVYRVSFVLTTELFPVMEMSGFLFIQLYFFEFIPDFDACVNKFIKCLSLGSLVQFLANFFLQSYVVLVY